MDSLENGASISNFGDMDHIVAQYRHYLKLDSMLLTGQASDNITGVRHASGLIPEMDARGTDQAVADYDIAQFLAAERILTKNHAPKQIGIFAATYRQQQIRQNLDTYFKDSNIDRARQTAEAQIFGKNKDAMRATLDFAYFTTGKYTFMLSDYEGLDNEATFNIAADETTAYYQNIGMVIPMPSYRDKKGQLSFYVGCKYLRGRKMIIGEEGLASSKRTTDVDERNIYCLSEMGGEFTKLNQTILIKES